jgi:hypothetical protein
MESEEAAVPETGERGRVKVIDRRRFTAEGDLRDGAATAAGDTAAAAPAVPAAREPEPAPAAVAVPTPPPPSVPSDVPAAAAEEPGGTTPLQPGPGIADVVDLLAQQAMAFLSGQVPGRGRDVTTARYFIDLLGVLKAKTSGRLTLEETNFLDDVLYQLRSLYVAATR